MALAATSALLLVTHARSQAGGGRRRRIYLFLAAKLTNKIKAHNCAIAPATVVVCLGLQYELNIARIFYFAAWCACAGKGGGLLTFPQP